MLSKATRRPKTKSCLWCFHLKHTKTKNVVQCEEQEWRRILFQEEWLIRSNEIRKELKSKAEQCDKFSGEVYPLKRAIHLEQYAGNSTRKG